MRDASALNGYVRHETVSVNLLIVVILDIWFCWTCYPRHLAMRLLSREYYLFMWSVSMANELMTTRSRLFLVAPIILRTCFQALSFEVIMVAMSSGNATKRSTLHWTQWGYKCRLFFFICITCAFVRVHLVPRPTRRCLFNGGWAIVPFASSYFQHTIYLGQMWRWREHLIGHLLPRAVYLNQVRPGRMRVRV